MSQIISSISCKLILINTLKIRIILIWFISNIHILFIMLLLLSIGSLLTNQILWIHMTQ